MEWVFSQLIYSKPVGNVYRAYIFLLSKPSKTVKFCKRKTRNDSTVQNSTARVVNHVMGFLGETNNTFCKARIFQDLEVVCIFLPNILKNRAKIVSLASFLKLLNSCNNLASFLKETQCLQKVMQNL